VDIAAPGRGIVSASDNHKYGPATGTSQAAPTVAAAAAYLMDPDVGWGKSPGQVKARLIGTANWNDSLTDMVWGGILNLGRAVRFPDSNLVSTFSAGKNTIIDIGSDASAKFKIENRPAATYERDGPDSTFEDRSIRLTRIVSIKSNEDADPQTGKVGTLRVVFIDSDDDTLRIMPAAELSGEIECSSARRWIPDTNTWQPDTLCDEDIDISQLYSFDHAMNYQITW
jgi:subtilisin family serine protease